MILETLLRFHDHKQHVNETLSMSDSSGTFLLMNNSINAAFLINRNIHLNGVLLMSLESTQYLYSCLFTFQLNSIHPHSHPVQSHNVYTRVNTHTHALNSNSEKRPNLVHTILPELCCAYLYLVYLHI